MAPICILKREARKLDSCALPEKGRGSFVRKDCEFIEVTAATDGYVFKYVCHILPNRALLLKYDQDLETWHKFKSITLSENGCRTQISPNYPPISFYDIDEDIFGAV